jgi:hypothetical protein
MIEPKAFGIRELQMGDRQKRDCGEPEAEKLQDLLAPTEDVTSIADFVRYVHGMTEKWHHEDKEDYDTDAERILDNSKLVGELWFRGHRDCNLSLRPGLYRENTVEGVLKAGASERLKEKYEPILFQELIDLEHEPRIDFISYGHLLNQVGQAANQIDWYFLMQHHGVPTRLLDWTTNALAALFFALDDYARFKSGSSGSTEKSYDPAEQDCVAVWMIDAYWLASRLSDDWGSPLLPWSEDALRYVPPLEQLLEKNDMSKRLIPEIPMPIEPPAMHPRVAAQEGRFIIFGRRHELLNEEIHRERNDDCKLEEARIVQIRFQPRGVQTLLEELAYLGVSRRTLFPDLGGLADFVRWKHFHKIGRVAKF